MPDKLPARTVMSSYQSLEAMLTEVLAIVPYCPAHEAVWSPHLVTVLLEAGSQIDSLWRAESRLSTHAAPKPDIVDFFTYFGEQVAFRWVVLWAEEPIKLAPFDDWRTSAAWNRPDYKPLSWWSAFAKLKHDRLQNRTCATLRNAVAAVAAVYLAILRCEQCRDEVTGANWLRGANPNPAAWLGEDSPETWNQWITAETTLFTYPVGWSRKSISKGSSWDGGPASHRFMQWHFEYEQSAS